MPLKFFLILLFFFLLSSCDLFRPQRSFVLAVPEKDYSYNYSAGHFKAFLERNGFQIIILPAENAIEANRLVSEGKADITFIMNHSSFIPEELGSEAGNLRSILPIFSRLFFLFAREWEEGLSIRENFTGKAIGIEVLGGETNTNLDKMMKDGQIESVTITTRDKNPDFIHFWGTYYGKRATELLNTGWKEISLSRSWVDFITLNEPALKPFLLPALPGLEASADVHTISTHTLLVGNKHLGENAVFELADFILQHKLELMGYDRMYQSINESFSSENLLYPIHKGTSAYLRRDEPGIFERYADVIALVLSIGAVVYGSIQTFRVRMAKKRKVRIDSYFLDFLDIRGDAELKNIQKIKKLDQLLEQSVLQMAAGKLDKSDFHIFSRLIQQAQTNLGQAKE